MFLFTGIHLLKHLSAGFAVCRASPWVLRQFQTFWPLALVQQALPAIILQALCCPPWRAAFSQFAPVVNWVSVLAWSNLCSKLSTRLRRAAYFRSARLETNSLFRPMFYSNGIHPRKHLSAAFCWSAWVSPWVLRRFCLFILLALCASAVAIVFHGLCSSSICAWFWLALRFDLHGGRLSCSLACFFSAHFSP